MKNSKLKIKNDGCRLCLPREGRETMKHHTGNAAVPILTGHSIRRDCNRIKAILPSLPSRPSRDQITDNAKLPLCPELRRRGSTALPIL
jgi:hypothetical protein